MKPPTISVRVSNTNVRIATGELLFPVLVLGFCAAYYIDTRGLPDRSMMYAGPLLYTTVLLAVVTVFKHAVSFDRQSIKRERGERNESTPFIGWGTDEETATDKLEKKSRSTGFGTSSAVGLAVLLIGYLLSLYVVPFVVGTAGFLGCALYILGERRPARILIYSLGFTILTWGVFVEWLLVPLP
jgi:hypothetical protein|nr:tripartite tricarboxylate transporter TctB family protein [Natronomonas aquatica]